MKTGPRGALFFCQEFSLIEKFYYPRSPFSHIKPASLAVIGSHDGIAEVRKL